MRNQAKFGPLAAVGDREDYITHHTRGIQFVINTGIRAWSDGNTDERRKRS
jgi:hypothetical protein